MNKKEEQIIAYITGQIDDENEKEEIRHRINKEETSKSFFIRVKNAYAISRKGSGTTDVDSEYLKFSEKAEKQSTRILLSLSKYAAIIILSVILTALVQNRYFNSDLSAFDGMNEVICPAGQTSELVLSDGTKVWLNAGSSMVYPSGFGNKQREVYLTGEAFFEVSRDKEHPFLVKTQAINVKVLGTSFNVEAYPGNRFNATLVEGKVELQDSEGIKLGEMSPGQLAEYDFDQHKINLTAVDTRFYSSWKEGKMTFFNETLEIITAKLERWYNVSFAFSSEEIKAYRFSGTILKYKPLEQVLEIIKLSSPIDYSITINPQNKNDILLTKRI